MRRFLGSILPILATCALLPVGLLVAFGRHMVMPPMWVHFYAVGVSARVATAAAVAITVAGARRGDTRTVIVGGGFSLMAALLVSHGDSPEARAARRRRVLRRQCPSRARTRAALGARRLRRRRQAPRSRPPERLDGTGYPRGLRRDDLDLPTRILAVCDVYDALVSPRVYRPAWTRDQALELLRSEADAGVAALEDVLAERDDVVERTPEQARALLPSPA